MPKNQKGSLVVVLLLMIILLLLILMGGGAYYLARNNLTSQMQPSVQIASNTSPSPVSTTNIPRTEEYTFTKHPADSSLKSFKVSYPHDWSLSTLSDNGIPFELDLSRNNHTIKIIQEATGGADCFFEGVVSEGPALDYRNTPFVEVKSDVGPFRRVATPPNSQGTVIFAFCGMRDNRYYVPTSIGAISYSVPINYDEKTLLEMDTILSGIKAIE